ncbi:MAG: hypothetical protein ACK521_04535 [bacterium]
MDPDWQMVTSLENYVRFEPRKATPWKEVFPSESEQFIDLLSKLL